MISDCIAIISRFAQDQMRQGAFSRCGAAVTSQQYAHDFWPGPRQKLLAVHCKQYMAGGSLQRALAYAAVRPQALFNMPHAHLAA